MLAMSAPPADYFDPDQSTLTWLQAWYMSNCNGDWEHGYGVSVKTLDNPGWMVRLELTGTPLNGRPFDRIQFERDEHGKEDSNRARYHLSLGQLVHAHRKRQTWFFFFFSFA